MIKITLTEAEIEALRDWRVHHPDPRVPVRMEALYGRRQGVANREIVRLCGISNARFQRYRKAYVMGAIEPLQQIDPERPPREPAPPRPTREAHFQEHPPASVAEAVAQIADRTGRVRKPTQGRQFFKALGRPARTVGMIPAKAPVVAPATFQKTRWSLGSLQPRRAAALSSAWMPPIACARPFGGLGGAFTACVFKRPRDASA